MPAQAVMVPYRSARALNGRRRHPSTLSGLAGSSKKRNWSAFDSAYPGTTVNASGNYVLPAKFGGVVINQGQLDDLAGTWYGATFHPDGDQAGWQQKFDAVLKQIGAFNAFYGVRPAAPAPIAPPVIAPLPAPVIPAIAAPVIPVAAAPNLPALAPSVTPPPAPVANVPAPSAPAAPLATPLPATVPPDQTASLIQQLMAQGASQQQAFTAALQSLAAQGVAPTPQVQQQVANDVTAASVGGSANTIMAVVGIAALGVFALLGRKKRRR